MPALLGSLVVFITSLQTWAQSCNSTYRKAVLCRSMHRGCWCKLWCGGGKKGTLKGSFLGYKNRNPGAMSKHCHFSRFFTMVREPMWAAAAMLYLHKRYTSAMLSVKCNGTSRRWPLFSWNLWTSACQCSHTKSSRDISNLLLLPANYSCYPGNLYPSHLPLMIFSQNNKHYHSHKGPRLQLS